MVVRIFLIVKRLFTMMLGVEPLFDIDETVNGHFETFATVRDDFCGSDLKGLDWIFK